MSDTAQIVVLGAGAIGVCAAIALQRAGRDVMLVDQGAPGGATSFGNAGVLNRGSILPLNNPGLPAALPSLLLGQRDGLTCRPSYLAGRPLWALRFLAQSGSQSTYRRATALHALISRSADLYPELLARAGAERRLIQKGWLKLYRKSAPPEGSFERKMMASFNIQTEALSAAETRELEPALSGIHRGALWIKDTASLDDPGRVVGSMADRFAADGGRILHGEAADAVESAASKGWRIRLSDGRAIEAETLVVALGPWSRAWLKRIGLSAPMAHERGAHREFLAGDRPLERPIYDVEGAYVLAPMEGRWRLTCGVELADMSATYRPRQLDKAEARMREALNVGARHSNRDWSGARPTLPDCLPAIGASSRRRNLFLAIGHQHIGVMTAPGTGELLAALLLGAPPELDPTPFAPSRYRL